MGFFLIENNMSLLSNFYNIIKYIHYISEYNEIAYI